MLEKKSVIYSDRPVLQMGGELVGWKRTLVPGSIWRPFPQLPQALSQDHWKQRSDFQILRIRGDGDP